MHTETTLFHFGNCTMCLGQAFHDFSWKCGAKFQTYDLPHETAACGRRKGAKSAKMGTAAGDTASGGPKVCTFNMLTYKLHVLGDYVKSIWQFGTTNNYSTQVVSGSLTFLIVYLSHNQGELEHHRVKHFYSQTNKIGFTCTIAKHQQCERLLHRIWQENQAIAVAAEEREIHLPTAGSECPSLHFVDQESLPNCAPDAHYQISQGKKFYWDLGAWLARNKDDKALEVHPYSLEELKLMLLQGFLQKLKNHILGCLIPGSKADDGDEEFTLAQHNALHFINNHIYCHKVLCINYTTYDLRWAQDSLNPWTHSDVMVLSHEDIKNAHPYWYAQIIGIFHTDVQYHGPELGNHVPRWIDFLWVQWFVHNRNVQSGWDVCRLPCIGFYPQGKPEAFGFIDPEQVIRAAHLIPAFHFGRTTALLPPSIACRKSEKDEDWDWYYVNM